MIKLGFLGCGDWVNRKYIPYILSQNNIDLVAVSDLVYSHEAERLQTKFPNVKIFDTHDELCKKCDVDGIVVSLPHALHFAAVKSALNSNIPTLVDKPLCASYSQARELVEFSQEKNISLAVSSQRRTQDMNLYAKELVREQKIGSISWIQLEFVHGSSPQWESTWRNDPALSGVASRKQGVLLDTGYHLIDSALHIINELPNKVYAQASLRNRQVDTDSIGILDFPSGTRVTIFVSRLVPPGYDVERITMLGTKGYFYAEKMECNSNKTSRMFYTSNGQLNEKISDFKSSALDPLIDFVNHLHGSKLSNVWEASTTLPTLQVLDALYTSIETQSQIKL